MNELDKLINELIKEKGGTKQQYLHLLNSISKHETGGTNSPTQKQVGGGPGRGKYQFGIGKHKGGITAAKRLQRYYKNNNKPVPKWLSTAAKGTDLDASTLTGEQQDLLFLGNMREHPRADLSKVMSGEQSVPEFWADNHWSGPKRQRQVRLKSFNSTYKEPEEQESSTKEERQSKRDEEWGRIQNQLAHKKSTEQARLDGIRDNFNEVGNSFLWNLPGSISPMAAEDLIIGGLGKGIKYLKGTKAVKKVGEKAVDFVSDIDWGKWNKEIPANAKLMEEYNAIEKSSKANGTWMKNPNGSDFKGTPEQFIQQNSSNFKKVFPDVVKDNAGNTQINYHGSPNKFTEFGPNKFYSGDFGKGIYTSPNKEKILKSYANPNRKGRVDKIREITGGTGNDAHLYELYFNAKNPKSFDDLYDVPYDIKNYGKNIEDFPTREELYKKHDKFLKENSWIKTDEDFDRFLLNMKVVPREKINLTLPDNDFLKILDTPLKEQVAPFSNRPKSAIGNNGMFDMTNPNIYKSIVGTTGVGTVLANQKAYGGSTGSTAQYNNTFSSYGVGGLHETNPNGGIPLGPKASVEQNETSFNFPNIGKYIFSHRIGSDGKMK